MIYPRYSSWSRSLRVDRYIPDLHDLYDLYDLYGLYDLAHVVGWEQHILHDLQHIVPGLDLYYTDPAQHLITAV